MLLKKRKLVLADQLPQGGAGGPVEIQVNAHDFAVPGAVIGD